MLVINKSDSGFAVVRFCYRFRDNMPNLTLRTQLILPLKNFFILVPYTVCSFDFEDGIGGWKKTGTAFDSQPTFGDNPTARDREPAQQQGNWWIGGAEYRPSPNDPAGKVRDQADAALGTLTSPCFAIMGKDISFLIGGGCDEDSVRAELIVNNQVQDKKRLHQTNLLLFVFCYLSLAISSS